MPPLFNPALLADASSSACPSPDPTVVDTLVATIDAAGHAPCVRDVLLAHFASSVAKQTADVSLLLPLILRLLPYHPSTSLCTRLATVFAEAALTPYYSDDQNPTSVQPSPSPAPSDNTATHRCTADTLATFLIDLPYCHRITFIRCLVVYVRTARRHAQTATLFDAVFEHLCTAFGPRQACRVLPACSTSFVIAALDTHNPRPQLDFSWKQLCHHHALAVHDWIYSRLDEHEKQAMSFTSVWMTYICPFSMQLARTNPVRLLTLFVKHADKLDRTTIPPGVVYALRAVPAADAIQAVLTPGVAAIVFTSAEPYYGYGYEFMHSMYDSDNSPVLQRTVKEIFRSATSDQQARMLELCIQNDQNEPSWRPQRTRSLAQRVRPLLSAVALHDCIALFRKYALPALTALKSDNAYDNWEEALLPIIPLPERLEFMASDDVNDKQAHFATGNREDVLSSWWKTPWSVYVDSYGSPDAHSRRDVAEKMIESAKYKDNQYAIRALRFIDSRIQRDREYIRHDAIAVMGGWPASLWRSLFNDAETSTEATMLLTKLMQSDIQVGGDGANTISCWMSIINSVLVASENPDKSNPNKTTDQKLVKWGFQALRLCVRANIDQVIKALSNAGLHQHYERRSRKKLLPNEVQRRLWTELLKPALSPQLCISPSLIDDSAESREQKRRRKQDQTSVSITTAGAAVKTFGHFDMEFVGAMLQYVLEQIEQRGGSITKEMTTPVHVIVTVALTWANSNRQACDERARTIVKRVPIMLFVSSTLWKYVARWMPDLILDPAVRPIFGQWTPSISDPSDNVGGQDRNEKAGEDTNHGSRESKEDQPVPSVPDLPNAPVPGASAVDLPAEAPSGTLVPMYSPTIQSVEPMRITPPRLQPVLGQPPSTSQPMPPPMVKTKRGWEIKRAFNCPPGQIWSDYNIADSLPARITRRWPIKVQNVVKQYYMQVCTTPTPSNKYPNWQVQFLRHISSVTVNDIHMLVDKCVAQGGEEDGKQSNDDESEDEGEHMDNDAQAEGDDEDDEQEEGDDGNDNEIQLVTGECEQATEEGDEEPDVSISDKENDEDESCDADDEGITLTGRFEFINKLFRSKDSSRRLYNQEIFVGAVLALPTRSKSDVLSALDVLTQMWHGEERVSLTVLNGIHNRLACLSPASCLDYLRTQMVVRNSPTKAGRVVLMKLIARYALCGRHTRVDDSLAMFETMLNDDEEERRKDSKCHPTSGHRDARLAIIRWAITSMGVHTPQWITKLMIDQALHPNFGSSNRPVARVVAATALIDKYISLAYTTQFAARVIKRAMCAMLNRGDGDQGLETAVVSYIVGKIQPLMLNHITGPVMMAASERLDRVGAFEQIGIGESGGGSLIDVAFSKVCDILSRDSVINDELINSMTELIGKLVRNVECQYDMDSMEADERKQREGDVIHKLENVVREWSGRVLSRDLGDDDCGGSSSGDSKADHDMAWYNRLSLFVQAFATSAATNDNNENTAQERPANDSQLLRMAMSSLADLLHGIGVGKPGGSANEEEKGCFGLMLLSLRLRSLAIRWDDATLALTDIDDILGSFQEFNMDPYAVEEISKAFNQQVKRLSDFANVQIVTRLADDEGANAQLRRRVAVRIIGTAGEQVKWAAPLVKLLKQLRVCDDPFIVIEAIGIDLN